MTPVSIQRTLCSICYNRYILLHLFSLHSSCLLAVFECSYLTCLYNWLNLIKKRSSRSFSNTITIRIWFTDLFCQSPFIHPFYMTKPPPSLPSFTPYLFVIT
jgi:hypothetical protein